MAYKLMYILNDNTQNYASVDYNYRLKCFDIHLNEQTNQKFNKIAQSC